MDSISQVIHDCETCAAIKQAKRVKPLWYGRRWSKYKYGEAWQIDYITLPQTRQGKRYVLTMVEATTGWLETYPVPHATARNTILGLEKQVLWRHGTPERIESDNGTHFKNSLINTWAREHGIEWVYHIPYHAPASGKVERYNGLLKTTLKALDFIIPPKQLLRGTKCFIWKEAQKVDYNHWKNGDLMKNECMVPPVTRYENSSKPGNPFVCLLLLRIVLAKTCSSFAQMGNLYSTELLASDVADEFVKKVKHENCYAIAIDESIEITDVAQMLIFI
ncbi:hypothetical protein DUI87_00938 [Hirundo rustica rustica]|uniref:Integrase catalytic domain-containing protein n=1 Tax=Hirundo rustica rustica TaxID=333673 RepID=A0A3M0L3D7_HIRRU|nr:hypothetical protein DUI87_00938 [Hirundo rustica rustica]